MLGFRCELVIGSTMLCTKNETKRMPHNRFTRVPTSCGQETHQPTPAGEATAAQEGKQQEEIVTRAQTQNCTLPERF